MTVRIGPRGSFQRAANVAAIALVFVLLSLLACCVRANALDCPEPPPDVPRPIPSPWIQKAFAVSISPSIPLDIGSETSGTSYEPQYGVGWTYGAQVTLPGFSYTSPRGAPTSAPGAMTVARYCGSSSIQYSRRY